nr:hypothetical protein [uncultured Psychroserpens sp.]
MIKNYLVFGFLLVVNINVLFSQTYSIPGEVLTDGEFKEGFFSNEISDHNNVLSFKFAESDSIINLSQLENVVFKINSDNLTYKTLYADGYIQPLILIIDGKTSFYSDRKSKDFYIQNLSKNSKLIKLENFDNTSNSKRNLGILSVIYEDCINVRSQLKNQNITKTLVIKLTNEYNNCASYSEGYELTTKQIRDQKYNELKSLYTLDFGGGITFNNYESNITGIQQEPSISNNKGYIIFLSLNTSPTYFKNLYSKLYFDISLSYNTAPAFKNEYYDISRSSLILNFSPTYYFRNDKNINPFARINFGYNYTNYDFKVNRASVFSDSSGSNSSFSYGFEAGLQLYKSFELAILYQPNSQQTYSIFVNNSLDLEVDTRVIALKASYIFNLSN